MAAWSTEETFKFIEFYRSERCIWNPKDASHKNKIKVNDSWKNIADQMGVPVSELKKKKETLMSAFCIHLKKKQSIRSGAGLSEIYHPIWVFYDAMEAFLKEVYECRSILNTEEEVLHLDNAEVDDDGIQKENHGQSHINQAETSHEMLATAKANIPVRKRRSNNPPELQEVSAKMNTAFTTLNEVLSKKSKDSVDEECALYGKLLALKLTKFSTLYRTELMHEIDGLIFKKRQTMGFDANIQLSNPSSPYSSVPSPSSNMPSPQSSFMFPHSCEKPASNYSQGLAGIQQQSQFTTGPIINDYRQSRDTETEAYNAVHAADHVFVNINT